MCFIDFVVAVRNKYGRSLADGVLQENYKLIWGNFRNVAVSVGAAGIE